MLHKLLFLPCAVIKSFDLQLILRALDTSMEHVPNQRLPVDQHMLRKLCHVCDLCGPMGHVLKVAFLFAYIGFLRQPNHAPPSTSRFDPQHHTRSGDVLLRLPGIVIILKWSKIHHRGQPSPLIPLPVISGSALCPLQAYLEMLQHFPTLSSNDPIIKTNNTSPPRALCCSQLSHAFKAII